MPKVPPLQFRREDIPDLSSGESTDRLLRGLNAFGGEAEALLNGGLTFKANFRAFAKDVTFTPRDEWTALALTNGWTAYGAPFETPGYRWNGRKVEFRGLAKAGALGVAMATVPPTRANQIFPRVTDAASGFAVSTRLDITAAGELIPSAAVAGTAWMPLDGVEYLPTTLPPANGVFPIRIKNELPGGGKPSHVFITGAWLSEGGTETPSLSAPSRGASPRGRS